MGITLSEELLDESPGLSNYLSALMKAYGLKNTKKSKYAISFTTKQWQRFYKQYSIALQEPNNT